jgi:hypothetical protein
MRVVKCTCHFDATSDERQLNDEGHISRYNNNEVPFLRLGTRSVVGPFVKKDVKVLRTLTDRLVCNWIF